MKSWTVISRAALVLALGLSAGCLKLERARPEKEFFLIEAQRPQAAQGPAARMDGTLQVRRFQIGPAYDSPAFVYRTSDSGYESDYYNAFFVMPASMLTEQCTRWLDASKMFERVVPLSSQVRGEYLLEGNVIALYGDYREASQPRAVIEMQILLLRDGVGEYEVVEHRDYSAHEAVTGRGGEALVAAWNRGLASILRDMESDLAAGLARGTEPAP